MDRLVQGVGSAGRQASEAVGVPRGAVVVDKRYPGEEKTKTMREVGLPLLFAYFQCMDDDIIR